MNHKVTKSQSPKAMGGATSFVSWRLCGELSFGLFIHQNVFVIEDVIRAVALVAGAF